jgi:hypothetical protein
MKACWALLVEARRYEATRRLSIFPHAVSFSNFAVSTMHASVVVL